MSQNPDSEPDLPSMEDETAQRWQQVFEESTPGLRAFLKGRLKQNSDIDDCLQVVFLKMIQRGGDVAPAARRAWLFRVAANESARMWRSKASTDKMLQRHGANEFLDADPAKDAILSETTTQLYRALERLPDSWRQVVRLRIKENLTFQEIADQLQIPLGTALTRMRRALERLKSELDRDTD